MKILFLVNKNTYLTKLCRVRFIAIEHLSKICKVHTSGINWPDYDNNLPVQTNIDNIKQKFDIIITYKPMEMKHFNKVKIPVCIMYNEMYNKLSTRKEIDESNAGLIICHHENDYKVYKEIYKNNDKKFIHIAHCAEKSIFKDYNYPKKYDIVLSGCLNGHYPLRMRFHRLLPILAKKYKVYIHPHPGYDISDAHTNRYLKELAQVYNSARIAFNCSGKPNTRYGKYVEIPMSHCAMVGDIPDEDIDSFKKFIIEVTHDMSDKEIINRVTYYLDNEEERLALVKKGVEWASKYTFENYATKLYKTIEDYLRP